VSKGAFWRCWRREKSCKKRSSRRWENLNPTLPWSPYPVLLSSVVCLSHSFSSPPLPRTSLACSPTTMALPRLQIIERSEAETLSTSTCVSV